MNYFRQEIHKSLLLGTYFREKEINIILNLKITNITSN